MFPLNVAYQQVVRICPLTSGEIQESISIAMALVLVMDYPWITGMQYLKIETIIKTCF